MRESVRSAVEGPYKQGVLEFKATRVGCKAAGDIANHQQAVAHISSLSSFLRPGLRGQKHGSDGKLGEEYRSGKAIMNILCAHIIAALQKFYIIRDG